MLKSELIEKIAAQNPHLYREDAEKIVNTILHTMTEALARGRRVELRGFGAFRVKSPDQGRGGADFVTVLGMVAEMSARVHPRAPARRASRLPRPRAVATVWSPQTSAMMSRSPLEITHAD